MTSMERVKSVKDSLRKWLTNRPAPAPAPRTLHPKPNRAVQNHCKPMTALQLLPMDVGPVGDLVTSTGYAGTFQAKTFGVRAPLVRTAVRSLCTPVPPPDCFGVTFLLRIRRIAAALIESYFQMHPHAENS
jgi:hypothetical protein